MEHIRDQMYQFYGIYHTLQGGGGGVYTRGVQTFCTLCKASPSSSYYISFYAAADFVCKAKQYWIISGWYSSFLRNVYFCSYQKNFMNGDTSKSSTWNIILIKRALSPSSTFTDNFDIVFWSFCNSHFNLFFQFNMTE